MDSSFRDVNTFPVETTRFPWKSRDNQAKTAELGLARSVLVCGKVGLLRDSMVCYVVNISKFSMNVQYFGPQLRRESLQLKNLEVLRSPAPFMVVVAP